MNRHARDDNYPHPGNEFVKVRRCEHCGYTSNGHGPRDMCPDCGAGCGIDDGPLRPGVARWTCGRRGGRWVNLRLSGDKGATLPVELPLSDLSKTALLTETRRRGGLVDDLQAMSEAAALDGMMQAQAEAAEDRKLRRLHPPQFVQNVTEVTHVDSMSALQLALFSAIILAAGIFIGWLFAMEGIH